jgi:hypothetical protein
MEASPFNINTDSGRFKIQTLKKKSKDSFVINYKLIENDILTYTILKA